MRRSYRPAPDPAFWIIVALAAAILSLALIWAFNNLAPRPCYSVTVLAAGSGELDKAWHAYEPPEMNAHQIIFTDTWGRRHAAPIARTTVNETYCLLRKGTN